MGENRHPSKQQQILDLVTKTNKAVDNLGVVVVGMPGTDDRGMAGEIRDIKTTQTRHGEEIARLGGVREGEVTAGLSKGKKAGLWGGVIALIATAVTAIAKAFARGDTQ